MNAMQDLEAGRYDAALKALYGARALHAARRRLSRLLQQYEAAFGAADEVVVVSAPGRTELGGNHTDHNGGLALAASVDADILAVAARRADDRVQMHAAGVPPVTLTLDTLAPRSAEARTSAALVRGVAAYLRQQWGTIGGFNAVTDARVPVGSGLSSSAAFEVLVGAVFNHLYNDGAFGSETLAMAGGYAENDYFGKPSGLLDQFACATGGVIALDFASPQRPRVRQLSVDWNRTGYKLCMVDVGGDHAGLTDAYAAIPQEMQAVARALGGERLADTSRETLLARLPELRAACGDRAVLRALHFFMENERVARQTEALEEGDMTAFLQEMTRSGHSSFEYLQNIALPDRPAEQPMAVALHLAQLLLEDVGGWRVHGGGFGGCIQTVMPAARIPLFVEGMEAALGKGCCRELSLRSVGSVRLTTR